ncbi:hypothetical protein [Butyrivibrio fibrisolvens]|uniref:Uncharacterized protein n=1 Tax=Butyrivibrio fibrisolvens TaxID=831 RepID=A0A317G5V4_BUTFI|nr:hypothetical protein [Butyrivibrio fibrisolvens]PWT28471.1 hypothetical protein CPT75_15805 [Butyrivibrio fibrisolvens]
MENGSGSGSSSEDGMGMPPGDMPSGEKPSGEKPSGDMESKSVTFETAEDYTDDFEVGDMVTITLEDGVVVSIEAAATNQ